LKAQEVDGRIALTWNAVRGAAWYRVERMNGTHGQVVAGGLKTAAYRDAMSQGPVRYRVFAVGANGAGAGSAWVDAPEVKFDEERTQHRAADISVV